MSNTSAAATKSSHSSVTAAAKSLELLGPTAAIKSPDSAPLWCLLTLSTFPSCPNALIVESPLIKMELLLMIMFVPMLTDRNLRWRMSGAASNKQIPSATVAFLFVLFNEMAVAMALLHEHKIF